MYRHNPSLTDSAVIMAGNLNRRALHFVFKIGDRHQAIKFFKDVLGMKVHFLTACCYTLQ